MNNKPTMQVVVKDKPATKEKPSVNAQSNNIKQVLIIDTDFRSTGTLSVGGDERIKDVFGFKPRHIKSRTSLASTFERLGHWETIEEDDDGFWFSEDRFVVDSSIGAIVLDTISGLQMIEKRAIKGNKESFSLPDWGKLGDKVENYVYALANCTTNMIMMAHTKTVEDKEYGRLISVPALSGRMSEELGRYLDIILYAEVLTDRDSNRIYRWLVLPTERMNARSSIQSLNDYAAKQTPKGYVEPSWVTIFTEVRKETQEPIKILLLGDFGSGKTFSLRTLKDCLHLL